MKANVLQPKKSFCKAFNQQGATTMTIQQAIEILRKHNEWRRGAEDIQPYAAIMIGEAIDVVANYHTPKQSDIKVIDDLEPHVINHCYDAIHTALHQAMYYLEILKNKEQNT
jgi:hypothetical protein